MGAANEWINGYLEAILDAGSSKILKMMKKKNKPTTGFEEGIHDDGFERKKITNSYNEVDKEDSCKPFSPTNYFVEEVVNSFDESDLYQTWTKVIATKNTRERNNRLENMCWRIWHLTRRKKQIALDDTQGRGISRSEKCGIINHDAWEEDLSELSEGEKEKGECNQPISSSDNNIKIPRINSDMQIWSDEDHEDKPRHLYIVLISLHGLVRGENMELGRDSDTGGQVKYVVELARALANMAGVHRVDLLTRQITSPELDSTYAEPIEMLSCPPDATATSCGAYIIRIPCGPNHKYIPKESLWPYIPEFIDGSLSHIVNMSRALGEQIQGSAGKPAWPYVIHGHYADAGEVAAHLSGVLNVPMVLTGHSLGRNKLEQLLKQGRLSREDINSTYKITRRIEAEEFGLDAAEMVVTSTRQEIEEQWGLYDGFDFMLERKLRVRRRRSVTCLGRYMPRIVVIPPGMDFSYVTNQNTFEGDGDLNSLIGSDRAQTKRTIPPIWSEIMRFFTNPHKPMILALSRPDPKKNVTTLLKAYGECPPLRELANLTLILGNREDIEEMSESSSVVLTTVLKLVDKYDLYGQVAYPKHHNQSQVPEIYRLAAKTKGVFINPALVEPFGLTLIEAAAYGLPVVATKNGGPVDIIKALNNGLLVDPHDHKAIADSLLKLVAEKNLWFECRKNGLKNIHRYSWPEHCRNYLSHVEHCRNRHPNTRFEITPIKEEEPMSDSLKGVEDLSLKFSTDSDIESLTRQKELIEAFTTHRWTASSSSTNGISSSNIAYCPGRRQRLFIVAADCYDREGCCTELLPMVIENVKQAAADLLSLNSIGLILLTGLTLQEIKELKDVRLEDFDAVVCSNGSEMCYPWKDCSSTTTADVEYEAHIEYRWPGENVKSTITRLGRIEGGGSRTEDDIVENPKAFSSRCFSYCIKPGAKTTRIDELRKRLRIRGLRCNPIYTRAASRLNVIPLLASRIQALRYLSVKWGIELSSMVVFTGDKGDTDYKDILEGLHKTVILPGITEYGSELFLCSTGESYMKKEDEGTSCLSLVKTQTHEVNDIITALKTLRFM